MPETSSPFADRFRAIVGSAGAAEYARGLLRRAWGVLPETAKSRLRANQLYQRLSHFAYPHRQGEFELERTFFSDLFRSLGFSPRLIFDIGANCGEKTLVFRALGAAVLAVEPTPNLVTHLRERFGNQRQVSIEGVAVSRTSGTATLWRVKNSDAMNTISSKNRDILASGENPRTPDRLKPELGEAVTVETVTLEDLIGKAGRPDYIKIDTEGHDNEVIAGLSSLVRLVSFEANLPEFAGESIEAVDHLCKLSPGAKFQARDYGMFILPDWVSADEIKTLLRGNKRFLDVFAHLG